MWTVFRTSASDDHRGLYWAGFSILRVSSGAVLAWSLWRTTRPRLRLCGRWTVCTAQTQQGHYNLLFTLATQFLHQLSQSPHVVTGLCCAAISMQPTSCLALRVSTTPGIPGNLLEFCKTPGKFSNGPIFSLLHMWLLLLVNECIERDFLCIRNLCKEDQYDIPIFCNLNLWSTTHYDYNTDLRGIGNRSFL